MTTNILTGKVNKEILEDLYWGKGLNSRQIGEMFGVTAVAIQYQLRKYGIPARDIHECHRGIGLGHPCYHITTAPRSEKTRRKLSIANTGKPGSMRGRRGWSHGLTKETSPILAQIGEKIRERWQDPEYIAKMMLSRKIKPNGAEKQLQAILDSYYPQEYKFTGDGSFAINGKIPDFTNCNGRKEVIELFGDGFHDPNKGFKKTRWQGTELGRIMIFNSFGFRCLVIWEHELKDTDTVLSKIKAFRKEGRRR